MLKRIGSTSSSLWTGAQAAERGLVDALGGIDTALQLAREAAGLDAGARIKLVYMEVDATDADCRGNEPIFADGSDTPGPGKAINPRNVWADFVARAVIRSRTGNVCRLHTVDGIAVSSNGRQVETLRRPGTVQFPTEPGKVYSVLPAKDGPAPSKERREGRVK